VRLGDPDGGQMPTNAVDASYEDFHAKSALNDRLGEGEHARLKDRSLEWDNKIHRTSVRESVKEAMDEHRKPAMFDPHGIKENLGRARMLRDAMKESIDVGHQGPMRELPKDKHTDPNQRAPKTVGQSVRLAMAAEKEAQRLGLTEENLERGHRFTTESRAVKSDPHFKTHQPSYDIVWQAAHNPNSNLSPQDRYEIGGWDPKTKRFDPSKASPLGLQSVTKRLRKKLGFGD
jgi:hypothetical protein